MYTNFITRKNIPKNFIMKKLLLFCGMLVLATVSFAQQFSLQIINNSTFGASGEELPLDIYINDSLYNSTRSLGYQDATELLSIPIEESFRISIAYSPSDSVEQSFVIYNLNQLEAGKEYIAVLNGEFGNQDNPFQLELTGGLELVPLTQNQVSLLPFNGLGIPTAISWQFQRSDLSGSSLQRGDFGELFEVNAGPQVVALTLTEYEARSFLFSIPFPEKDSISYAFLVSGSPDGPDSLTIYAVSKEGDIIIGQLIDPVPLVINEIDYDQPGTDDSEFIELKNIGDLSVSLNGIDLELVNGSTGRLYDRINLPAINLAPDAYFVVCFNESVSNCDFQVEGSIQNGGSAPDAVLLAQDNAIIDAVSYEGTLPGYTEGSSNSVEDTDSENTSISRIADGQDSNNNDQDFQSVCSTPGGENFLNRTCELPATTDSILVQIIHDIEGLGVLNPLLGDIDFGDLDYQKASAFIKVPSGVERSLNIFAGTGTVPSSVIDSNFIFHADSVYSIVIEGNGAEFISLQVNALARAEAKSPFATDFNFYHGLLNGPEVDVLIKRVGFATNGLVPFAFSDYVSALPGIYLLDIIDKTTGEIIATFELDLRQIGGQANTLLISQTDGEIELFSFSASGERTTLPLVEFAQVQLIHNIPNIQVDVYIDDVLIVDNVDYRSASAFLEVRANKNLALEVKGAESTPADPPILAFDNVRFEALSSSLLVLGGDGTDTSPVDLFILKNALESTMQENQVRLGFFHGGTDVNPLSFLGEQFEALATEVEFGRFRDYLSFTEDELVIAVRESSTERDLGFFGADLSSKKGQAGLVFSSGVVEDSQTFGLFIAFADGTVIPMQVLDFTRLQLVNNMPDSTNYDIYVGDKIWKEDLAYLEATPFMNVKANQSLSLSVVPVGEPLDSSIFVEDGITFVEDSTYQIFVNGQMEQFGYPVTIAINDQAKEFTSQDFALEVTAHHGSLATSVLKWTGQDGMILVDNLFFGGFKEMTSLSPLDQLIQINEEVTSRRLGAFEATLSQLPPGSPVVLFTSGLPGSEFSFSLCAVLPDGRLICFDITDFAKLQFVNAVDQELDVYLNGELIASNLGYRQAIPFQTLRAGETYAVEISEQGAGMPEKNGGLEAFVPAAEEAISIFATGQVGEETLFINRRAKDNAGGENKFTFNFFQGSRDETSLDLILQNFTTLYRDVSYGSFTDYTLIEPLSSDPVATFEIGRTGTSQIIGTYDADFSSFDNQAMTVFTSGTFENDFALWAVLPDGFTYPFTVITNIVELQLIQADVQIFPNPSNNIVGLSFELLEEAEVSYQLLNAAGQVLLRRPLGQLNAGKYQNQFSVSPLSTGVYFLQIRANKEILTKKVLVNH